MSTGTKGGWDYDHPPRSKKSNHKSRHVALMSRIPVLGRSRLLAHVQAGVTRGNRELASPMAFLRVWDWVGPYLRETLRKNAKYRSYPKGESGIFAVKAHGGEAIRMAVAADWGTGTLESEQVAHNMRAQRPHYTLHGGDVYHLGDTQEVEENFLGKVTKKYSGVSWPKGSRGSFALMGNHEMYSGGRAYYAKLLPAMGLHGRDGAVTEPQRASFFCLESEHWIVLGLDTGYHSGGNPVLGMIPGVRSISALNTDARFNPKMMEWLRTTMETLDTRAGWRRPLVVLSHHQPLSAFEEAYTRPPRQMAELDAFRGREFVWLYGHEHRFTVYKKAEVAPGIVAWPRCIGHGGMPVSVSHLKKPDSRVLYYDPRTHPVDCEHPQTKVGYNGHALLTFEGEELKIEYCDIHDGRVLFSEAFAADGKGGLRWEKGEASSELASGSHPRKG